MTAVPKYVTKLGACRGADANLFFPLGDDRQGDEALEAEVVGYLEEQYCSGCPARKACFEYAVANEKFGVWAGTTSQDRRRLRAAAKRETAAAKPASALVNLASLIRGEGAA